MLDRAKFYSGLRGSDLFPSGLKTGQVRGMEGILDAFQEVGDGRPDTLSYGLATSYHETVRRMEAVREGLAKDDAGARRAVRALARKRGPRSAVACYAQPVGPYAQVYYGRGHAQLTWHENYLRMGKRLGIDLERNPDLMLDPTVSAKALFIGLIEGWWDGRGRGLHHYADADGDREMDHDDTVEARRTVNGQDKAELIAGHFKAFAKAVDAAWIASPKISHPTPIPRPGWKSWHRFLRILD